MRRRNLLKGLVHKLRTELPATVRNARRGLLPISRPERVEFMFKLMPRLAVENIQDLKLELGC
jgi:hypothetical protein